METKLLNLKLWLNLTLVIVTSYVFIWYMFAPSHNQCQMTFMMEPPKFIPIPIEDTHTNPRFTYSQPQTRSLRDNNDYKLYMYSELGFPQISNVQRDLKDSMPVLFVPGNAGSYQQVRSLASTCIRLQLQSLEAYKFVFYTIDFKGQLSGLSGDLIEDQTDFVHKSLIQIAKIHPVDLDGIVLIGHSVGGFISKVLFTLPNFNPSSVALLISLAGPLIKPYLTFDDKMRTLYDKTNEYWSLSKLNTTLAVSISGGDPDRLVPTHLSIDTNFDLSISTSSIKHVWLETDHVCITWCRELMHKLAHLLSALMDKKKTRIITDRATALPIVKEELLVGQENSTDIPPVIFSDWKTMKPYIIIDFREFYSGSRTQLSNNIIILNTTSIQHREDLLIIIQHIGSLKTTSVFGCEELEINVENGQITCSKRINLMYLAKPLPTRRFEPRKTVLKLRRKYVLSNKYILLDYHASPAYGSQDKYLSKVPETVIVQQFDFSEKRSLYIPNLLEYIFHRAVLLHDYSTVISLSKSVPLAYLKYKIDNLKQNTQVFNLVFESTSCKSTEHPYETIIMLSKKGFLSQSFSPSYSKTGKPEVFIKLNPYETLEIKEETKLNSGDYLELFIDGTCVNTLQIKLDVMSLVINTIQRNLGKILAGATYITYQSIVFYSFNLSYQQPKKNQYFIQESLSFMGFVIVCFLPNFLSSRWLKNSIETDEIMSFLLLYISSNGVIAYLNYFIRRLVDLATIINNAQTFLRQRFCKTTSAPSAHAKLTTLNFLQNEIAWILIVIAITGSLIFSAAVLSVFKIISVIKLKLSLDSAHIEQNVLTNKHLRKKQDKLGTSHILDLLINIGIFCALALIANIPSALTRFSSNKFNSFSNILDSAYKEVYFLASSLSLILIKTICENLEAIFKLLMESTRDKKVNKEGAFKYKNNSENLLHSFFSYAHLLSLLPIFLVELNICNIVLALTISLIWLHCYSTTLKMNIASSVQAKL